jgi:hypothetical protein
MSLILDIDRQWLDAVHIQAFARLSTFSFFFFSFFFDNDRERESTYKTMRKGSIVGPTRPLVHLHRCS